MPRMPPTNKTTRRAAIANHSRAAPVNLWSIYICRRLSETNILGKCLRSGLGLPRFVISDYRRPSPDGGISQPVGFNIVFTRNMRYREVERAGQFSTGPMQRIEPRTATGVFPRHLFDHDFGIGKNVECSSAKF